MASTLPPVRGATFTFLISLVSQADTDIFQTSVTLAAGDVTVSLDGGGVVNITNLPTEIAATGILVVAMTAAQMTADVVTVRFHDAAGAEWQDALVTIYTGAQTFDTTDAIVDTIEGQTDDIGVAGAGLTALGDIRIANLDTTVSSRGTADPADAMTLTAGSLADIADEVWDELIAGHLGVGSTGAALNAAGAAGDPWATLLPGAYLAGQAGNIIGNIVDRVWAYATRTLTGTIANVVIASPVLDGGNVNIVQGDVYENVDGRRLEWSSTTWAIAVTSTIIVVIVNTKAFAGARLSATEVGLELTSAQTLLLPTGSYLFYIQEVQADGERITLLEGTWTVTARPIPPTV